MTPREFFHILKEAHGCELPSYGCLFIEAIADRYVYDCWLIDWDVTISVPLPLAAVVARLCFDRKQPEDYRTLKVLPATLFAYALGTFDKQPERVQRYLRGRFGPLLPTMRSHAATSWRLIEAIDLPTNDAGDASAP